MIKGTRLFLYFKVVKKELDIEINSLNDLFEAYVNKINSQVLDKQIKMISTH